jgi:hypothetical protein
MGFQVWGAGMGFNMNSPADTTLPPGSVDLSAYKGIRLWAKVNNATSAPVRMKMLDKPTTANTRGGTCDGFAGKCDDNFGFVLAGIGTAWTYYDVPFTTLKQEGWGAAIATGPNLAEVIGFQFQVKQNIAFDYAVDGVELYK